MKVELKTRMAGPKGNGAPGQVLDVDAETAKALIDGGFAEASGSPVTAVSEPEPVVVNKPATKKKGAAKDETL